MNETKHINIKINKPGDGLSKKERRALKVVDKINPILPNVEALVPPKNEPLEISGLSKKERRALKVVDKINPILPNVEALVPPKNEPLEISGLSKKERRALKVVDKINPILPNVEALVPPKNEPLEISGLSKKERRALKVVDKINPILPNVEALVPPKNEPLEISGLSKKERRALKVNENQVDAPQIVKTDIKVKEQKPNIEKKIINKIVSDVGLESKSKAQLKAERREIQEKQRLAKIADSKPEIKLETKSVAKIIKSPKKEIVRKEITLNQVQLFNHLYIQSPIGKDKSIIINVHPSFIKLGAQYSAMTILGSNSRCLALLSSVKDLIEDFVTPQKQELCRSLETYLQNNVAYLQQCRPFAVSMTNALRHFKVHSTQIRTDLADNDKKSQLYHIIDDYIRDEINTAGTAISMKVAEKICNGDVILTYSCSSLIKRILLYAHIEGGKKFKVIIVDGRPLLEGREMLRKLVSVGIDCTYILINGISFIMSKVTKVLLGTHALLANGYVMARTGTAQVALIAQGYNKPVLVCCETYKFSERVQTDSFVYNEIGNADCLSLVDTLEEPSPLQNIRNNNFLTPLNLMYDVTPPDLVTAVVTELGFLPCTSVPVVLRIKPTE